MFMHTPFQTLAGRSVNMRSDLAFGHGRIGIAIIEEDATTREAMTTLLSRQPGFAVVAAGPDFTAMNDCDDDADVILIDGRLERTLDWINSPALVLSVSPPKIIATGVSTNNRNLLDLIRAGVSGFVVKDALFSELVSTIRAVASGAQVLPTRLVATLVRNLTRNVDNVLGSHVARSRPGPDPVW
jgi:DNA-binding NarL/FixJ family response regulator